MVKTFILTQRGNGNTRIKDITILIDTGLDVVTILAML